jgi:hypothetical protein
MAADVRGRRLGAPESGNEGRREVPGQQSAG